MLALCIELANTFIWVYCKLFWKNSEQTFGQPNTIISVFISKIRLSVLSSVIKCGHAGYDPLPTCVERWVLETASPMDVSVLRDSSAWQSKSQHPSQPDFIWPASLFIPATPSVRAMSPFISSGCVVSALEPRVDLPQRHEKYFPSFTLYKFILSGLSTVTGG